MSSLNYVMLMGHLGHDPELRHSPKGTAISAFRMATSKRWKDADSGERHERTEWHRVVVFGQQATFLADKAKKGALLHVAGSLRTREWTDKKNVKRYTTEIVARQVQLLEKRPGPATTPPRTEEPPTDRPEVEEDAPDGTARRGGKHPSSSGPRPSA